VKLIIEKFKMYGFKKCLAYSLIELKNKIISNFLKNSYSQKGEDLIIDKLLEYKKNGFYVDVGAYDPHRFSNTKRFYKKGWHGINIEPNPDNYQKFVKYRKRDVNLNVGIGNVNATLNLYKFIPNTLSTFSKEEADRYIKQGYKLKNIIGVSVKKLVNVLNEYPKDKEIDFITIDTEGFDIEVLKSNDWLKFKPKLICIESVKHTIDGKNNKKKDNHELFLKNVGYEKAYNNGLNSLYILNELSCDNFSNIQRKEFNKFAKLRGAKKLKSNKALEFEYAKILSKMDDNLSENIILDLGCGMGRYSMEIAKKAKEVVGFDVSDKSIEIANSTSKNIGINNFNGVVGDFKNVAYSNYFDYVLIVNVFHHIRNKFLIFQNIKKALKDDGKLIIFEFNPLNLMFIPFLVFIGQIKSHLNFEYWQSNIFNLKNTINNNGFNIKIIEKYAFLPTCLYNYSMYFEKLNMFLNNIPILNIFNAFNIIICSKNDK